MDIDRYLPAIVSGIAKNVTYLLVAPTGSGKSVGVPQALAQSKTRTGKPTIVRVTVPTRASAIGLYSQQKKTLGEKMVGFAAESQVQYNPSTPIAYVTTGHMRRKMLNMFKKYFDPTLDPKKAQNVLNFCNVLFVDEIHIGTIDNDIVVGLWSKAYAMGMTVPHLLLASATPIEMAIEPPPFRYDVNIPRRFSIQEVSHGITPSTLKGELYIETIKVVIRYLTAFEESGNDGHILVFVPGKKEIKTLVDVLSRSKKDRFEVFGLSGESDETTIQQVLSVTNKRKIVIATNVAETSITIKDLGLVVDTLLEKTSETTPNGGLKLITTYISKDSARQRRGRTGRTRDGIYYYMASDNDFRALPDHRPPEILRVPLHKYVLELLDVGLDPEEILRGAKPGSIRKSLTTLSKLGMIDSGGRVTEKGRKSVNFPLNIESCSFLYDWVEGGEEPYVGVVIAALIESYSGGFYFVPNDRELRSQCTTKGRYLKEHFADFEGETNLETAFNIWNSFLKIRLEYPSENIKDLMRKWCGENSLNNKKLGNVLNLLIDMSKFFQLFPTILNYRKIAPTLSKYFASSYPIFQLRGRHYTDSQGKIYNIVGPKTNPKIIGLSTLEIGTDKNAARSIDLFVPYLGREEPENEKLSVIGQMLTREISFDFVSIAIEYYRYRYAIEKSEQWSEIKATPFFWRRLSSLENEDHVFPDSYYQFYSRTATSSQITIIQDYFSSLKKVLDKKSLGFPRVLKDGSTLYVDGVEYTIPSHMTNYPTKFIVAALFRHVSLGSPDYPPLRRGDWLEQPQLRLLGANPFHSNEFPFYSQHMDVDAPFGGIGLLEEVDDLELFTYRPLTEEEAEKVLNCTKFQVWSVDDQPLLDEYQNGRRSVILGQEKRTVNCYSN